MVQTMAREAKTNHAPRVLPMWCGKQGQSKKKDPHSFKQKITVKEKTKGTNTHLEGFHSNQAAM